MWRKEGRKCVGGGGADGGGGNKGDETSDVEQWQKQGQRQRQMKERRL